MHLTTRDGARVHFTTDGSEGGPVVVLVHGLAGSIELSWRSTGVIDTLAKAGLLVIAVDLRGHGLTTTTGAPEQLDQSRLVEDVRVVVERFRGRTVVLVGYSLGAALALLALQDGLRVNAAIIAGAAPSVLRWTDEDERRRAETAAALRGSTDVDEDLLGFVAFFESIGADTDSLANLFDHHRPTVENWERIVDRVFVVAGADDTIATPVEALVQRLPNATAHRVPGDHYTAPRSWQFCDLVLEAAGQRTSDDHQWPREVESADIRSTLRRHLRERLIARDKLAVQVIRVAIAAIENAEAQPLDGSNQTEFQLEASRSSDVARRVVSDDEARALVAGEIDHLLIAARHYHSLGERESAVTVEEQADILRNVLSPES